MIETFKALVVRESEGTFVRAVEERAFDDLPAGDVTIRVRYSSLNYKDALSASGHRGITRSFPHTPGIDAAGVVERSDSPDFNPGDSVLVTGYDLGMNTSGGLADFIRVPAGWVVPLPGNLTLWEAMALGTAGFTAAMCLHRLETNGLKPGDGEVAVTGATGGVGSLAAALLAKRGHRVVAVSRKANAAEYLLKLGASEVVPPEALEPGHPKPLRKPRWAGAVDTVGGPILEALLKQLRYGAGIACCGMVSGAEINTTIFPFILQNAGLYGIASAECPMPLRLKIWEKLAGEWKPDALGAIAHEHPLEDAPALLDDLLAGRMTGRAVIRL